MHATLVVVEDSVHWSALLKTPCVPVLRICSPVDAESSIWGGVVLTFTSVFDSWLLVALATALPKRAKARHAAPAAVTADFTMFCMPTMIPIAPENV